MPPDTIQGLVYIELSCISRPHLVEIQIRLCLIPVAPQTRMQQVTVLRSAQEFQWIYRFYQRTMGPPKHLKLQNYGSRESFSLGSTRKQSKQGIQIWSRVGITRIRNPG